MTARLAQPWPRLKIIAGNENQLRRLLPRSSQQDRQETRGDR